MGTVNILLTSGLLLYFSIGERSFDKYKKFNLIVAKTIIT